MASNYPGHIPLSAGTPDLPLDINRPVRASAVLLTVARTESIKARNLLKAVFPLPVFF